VSTDSEILSSIPASAAIFFFCFSLDKALSLRGNLTGAILKVDFWRISHFKAAILKNRPICIC